MDCGGLMMGVWCGRAVSGNVGEWMREVDALGRPGSLVGVVKVMAI